VPPREGPEEGDADTAQGGDRYVNKGEGDEEAAVEVKNTLTKAGSSEAEAEAGDSHTASAEEELWQLEAASPNATDQGQETAKPEPDTNTNDPPEAGPKRGDKEETDPSGRCSNTAGSEGHASSAAKPTTEKPGAGAEGLNSAKVNGEEREQPTREAPTKQESTESSPKGPDAYRDRAVPPEAGPEHGITLVTNAREPYVNTAPDQAACWARFSPEDTETGPGAWPAVENSADSAPNGRQETGPTLPKRTNREAAGSDRPDTEARTSEPPNTGPEEGVTEDTEDAGTTDKGTPNGEDPASEYTDSVE